MKLRQIVDDGSTLTLTKEKKVIPYGKEFEIKDEERANEILNARYHGKPVAEIVASDEKNSRSQKKFNQEDESNQEDTLDSEEENGSNQDAKNEM